MEDREKQRKKFSSVFWLRGLAILLVIIFAFTIASRVAASFTVAKVTVTNVSKRKIQHTVSAAGRVEQNGEFAVITEPDILVKNIAVQVGENVEKGSILMQLDMDSLSEQIDSVRNDIRTLELQNQALQDSESQNASKRNIDIQRAKEDYDEAIQKNANAVSRAEQELQQAKDNLEQAKQELQASKDALKKQQNSGEPDEAALADLQDKVEEKQAAYETCQSEVSEKEDALQAAYDTQQAEQKSAVRALEDARTPQATDNGTEINEISMKTLKNKLEKLQELEKQEGQIVAPESGVVTNLNVSVGQKTMDTAVATMSDESAGLRFVAQISVDDAEYVSAGDKVTLSGIGKSAEDCEVISVEADESGELMNVTANVNSEDFKLGENATMNVIRESEEYSCTVPATALRQENNKMYVFLLDTEDTILGQQYVVRKTEVKVLDKNGDYAALDGGALNNDSQIIIETDRYVEDGARVRLMDE